MCCKLLRLSASYVCVLTRAQRGDEIKSINGLSMDVLVQSCRRKLPKVGLDAAACWG